MRTDVSPQDVLDLFLLETTLDDQPAGAVDGTCCSHFGEHELDDVLGLAMHSFADIGDVCKDCLFVSFSHDRRGCDCVPLRA